jgi:hypothetical protein
MAGQLFLCEEAQRLKSKQLGLGAHAYNLSTQRLRQEDGEAETSLGYIARPCPSDPLQKANTQ